MSKLHSLNNNIINLWRSWSLDAYSIFNLNNAVPGSLTLVSIFWLNYSESPLLKLPACISDPYPDLDSAVYY